MVQEAAAGQGLLEDWGFLEDRGFLEDLEVPLLLFPVRGAIRAPVTGD